MGRTCCVQKLFLSFRTISVHNMFSPCSAKIGASNKDLPVWEPNPRLFSIALSNPGRQYVCNRLRDKEFMILRPKGHNKKHKTILPLK